MTYLLLVISGLVILIGLFILNKTFITNNASLSKAMAISEALVSFSLFALFFFVERNFQLLKVNNTIGGTKRSLIILAYVFGLFLKLDLDAGVYMYLSKKNAKLLSVIAFVNGIIPIIEVILVMVCRYVALVSINKSFDSINNVFSFILGNNNELMEICCLLPFIIPFVHLLLIRFGVNKTDASKAVSIANGFLKGGYKITVGLTILEVKIMVSMVLFLVAITSRIRY